MGVSVALWVVSALVAVSLVEKLVLVNGESINLKIPWTGKQVPTLDPPRRFGDAVVLVAALALLVAVSWALRTRRRLVVEDFADHAGGDRAPAGGAAAAGVPAEGGPAGGGLRTAGLATRLTLALTRLADLHHGSGDPSPVSTHAESGGRKGRMVLAQISSDSDPAFLRDAVSAESTLSVGPLNIPIGLLVGFFGRLARGPRVVGSLHRDGDLAILAAQVTGADRSLGWTVTRPGGCEAPIGEMVEELACRIYTDVAMDRTTKWRATRLFGEGLDAYRDTLRTPLNRRLNLRRAERSFLESSAEDQNFDLAYYNLGVVYRDLGKPQAAFGAFMRTIELNPDRLEAYYALAANRWRAGDNAAALALCDRVIAGGPGPMVTEAHNLRSLALGYQKLKAGDPDWGTVLAGQRRAVRSACRGLGRAYLGTQAGGDREIEGARVELSTCLVTLAFAWRQTTAVERERRPGHPGLARAEWLIERAVALDPSAPQLHFSLGDVRLERGRHREAAVAFRAAAQIAPGNLDYFAHLALALARAGEREDAARVIGRALGSPYSSSRDALNVVADAFAALSDDQAAERVRQMRPFLAKLAADVALVDGGGPHADRVATMHTFLGELAQQMEQAAAAGLGPDDVAVRLRATQGLLRAQLGQGDWEGRAWERAQIEILLAYLATRDEDWCEAELRLEAAIEGLTDDHPQEVGDRGLRAELARVQLHQTRKGDALATAEDAVDRDPFSPKARAALADVRSTLGQHEAARKAHEIALLRDPEAPEGHLRLGQCILTLAHEATDRDRRDDLLSRATEHLRQALDLYPSDAPHEAVEAHELLGRILLERREHGEAIARFEIARALRRRDGPAALERLAVACQRNGDYPHAERVCLELTELVSEGDPTEVLDRAGGVEHPRGELLARAHLLRARARVERDVELHRALQFVRSAKRYLKAADDGGVEPERAGGPFADVEAQCFNCEGLILSRQGKLDEALGQLEHAALLGGGPQVYVRLALVSVEKAELQAADEVERHTLLDRAAAYCRRAAKADGWQEHTEEIGDAARRVASSRGGGAEVAGEPAPTGPRAGDRQSTQTRVPSRAR